MAVVKVPGQLGDSRWKHGIGSGSYELLRLWTGACRATCSRHLCYSRGLQWWHPHHPRSQVKPRFVAWRNERPTMSASSSPAADPMLVASSPWQVR